MVPTFPFADNRQNCETKMERITGSNLTIGDGLAGRMRPEGAVPIGFSLTGWIRPAF